MERGDVIYDLLIKNFLLVSDGDRQFFGQYQLSQVRYFTLLHVSQNPQISLKELSALLLCTKGNTTRIVKSMERDAYLTRAVDQHDNRALQLQLTEKGEEILARMKAAYQEYNQQRFAAGDVDAEVLVVVLARLNKQLRAALKTGS
ncbi:MAG: hypothetical protein CVU39_17290 [Chloroflexi bacterium HGW-Chloroflexi-10]|jgi:DNA-binding MarR family transcriptional regulator|nr:MAG: hypothetical protein CVU39_17290 [Chloroflexi bacterium HGW-Chloroflexi-10]